MITPLRSAAKLLTGDEARRDQLARIFRTQLDVWPKLVAFDREVLAANEAPASHLVRQSNIYGRAFAREWGYDTITIGPPRLLRHRSERPCNTRAHKRDKLAPPHRFPRAETLLCFAG
jgi:hypothetical protein